jgi:ParB family transcriptional regulator, chromosome partitioning protein
MDSVHNPNSSTGNYNSFSSQKGFFTPHSPDPAPSTDPEEGQEQIEQEQEAPEKHFEQNQEVVAEDLATLESDSDYQGSRSIFYPEPEEHFQRVPESLDQSYHEMPTERISYADASVMEVPINEIVPNPFQPRKTFDPNQLQELAGSIREHGVIQPLVVNKTDNGYELVVGERRFRASQLAGLERVPVIVKSGMHDQAKLEVALIENIQRQELNPIEEAQAYDKLMRMFGLTQDKVAQKVGKSRPAIANTVRLLNLPIEIQRGIIENRISEGHARAILGLNGIERQLALYKMILDQNLNVRQVEIKVRELMSRPRLEAAGPDPRTLAYENELRSKLGTKVKIEKKGRGGKIMIEFFSEDELSDLMSKISTPDKTEFFIV